MAAAFFVAIGGIVRRPITRFISVPLVASSPVSGQRKPSEVLRQAAWPPAMTIRYSARATIQSRHLIPGAPSSCRPPGFLGATPLLEKLLQRPGTGRGSRPPTGGFMGRAWGRLASDDHPVDTIGFNSGSGPINSSRERNFVCGFCAVADPEGVILILHAHAHQILGSQLSCESISRSRSDRLVRSWY